ncbi:hypothetical protein KKG46_05640 [Patescibacteria group bacterium]|nr:hypothetical protein [Patescibacteria group bacterium]
MRSLAEQFEQKIQNGQMPQPIPFWQIKAKRILIWVIFGSFVFVGIASSAVAVWFVTDPQTVILEYQKESFLDQLLSVLPMFWIGLSFIMALAAVVVFVHAPRAYRYRTVFVVSAIVLAFVAFGGAISVAGFSEKIELFAEMMPGYRYVQMPHMQRFMQPEQGMMLGQIKAIDRQEIFMRDVSGVIWHVNISNCSQPLDRIIKPEGCIRVLGVPSTTENYFDAEQIAPCPRGIRPPVFEMKVKESIRP